MSGYARDVKCPHCGKCSSILHGSSVLCSCGIQFEIEENLCLGSFVKVPQEAIEVVQGGIWMPEQEQDRRITELEKRVTELESRL